MWAMGQIYLDTGKGKGMVRAFIFKGGLKCGPAKAGVKIVVKKAVSFGSAGTTHTPPTTTHNGPAHRRRVRRALCRSPP
jgi:hypothetical protein